MVIIDKRYSAEEYAKIKEQEKKELAENLSEGIKRALDSDKYKSYLKFMGNCHNYSYTNSMLIYLQNEKATVVKSFTDWKKDKVNINKNEKGIKIFCPVKKRINIYQKDKGGNFVLDDKGEKIKESEKEITNFIVGNVFDISQTNANSKNYQLLIYDKDKIQNKGDILNKLEKVSNIKFEFKDNLNGASGRYFPKKEKIEIKANMEDLETISTCIHEVAHSILHKDINKIKIPKKQVEFEAESVAYVVCNKLNINCKNNNFLYLANWVGKEDISEFKNSLDRIQKASNDILKEFDIQKENIKINVKENEVVR